MTDWKSDVNGMIAWKSDVFQQDWKSDVNGLFPQFVSEK